MRAHVSYRSCIELTCACVCRIAREISNNIDLLNRGDREIRNEFIHDFSHESVVLYTSMARVYKMTQYFYFFYFYIIIIIRYTRTIRWTKLCYKIIFSKQKTLLFLYININGKRLRGMQWLDKIFSGHLYFSNRLLTVYFFAGSSVLKNFV